MGFQAGTNGTETGGFGFTKSNANTGLSGRADPVNPQDDAVPNGAGGCGVFGFTTVRKAAGVFGVNDVEGRGVQGNGPEAGVGGFSAAGFGVIGQSTSNTGVIGTSATGRGVQGNGSGPEAGVGGFSAAGFGVIGQSTNNAGVMGTSQNGQGLSAFSDNNIGIFAQGATFAGVFHGALVVNAGPNPKNTSVHPSNINGSVVISDGNLFVTKGDVILGGADCAEEFDIDGMENVESGMVMVINKEGLAG